MYNFLLIEDSPEDSSLFEDTVKRLNMEAEEDLYHLEVAPTYDDGMKKISKNLNGIIVDIKLDDGHNGNDIVRDPYDQKDRQLFGSVIWRTSVRGNTVV